MSVFRKILFATDFSAASSAAYGYAASLSDRYQSDLYIAHVISREPFELLAPESSRGISALDQASQRAHEKILELVGIQRSQSDSFHTLIDDGNVPEVLVDMIRDNGIDLAILGTHGRRAFKKV